MFELSSKPSIFFQHNLKYIGAEVRHTAFAHLFHKCYLQPPQHSPVINVTKNDISSFSIILIIHSPARLQ